MPKEIRQVPADRLLAEELVDDEVVEMANLTTAQTGVTGTIFISTAMGGHGLRVKYFLQPGRSQSSFSVSIADSPAVLANSLPIRVLRQMSPQVIAWVSRNKDALLDFWYHGDAWTQLCQDAATGLIFQIQKRRGRRLAALSARPIMRPPVSTSLSPLSVIPAKAGI